MRNVLVLEKDYKHNRALLEMRDEMPETEANAFYSLAINIVYQTRKNEEFPVLCAKERSFGIIH